MGEEIHANPDRAESNQLHIFLSKDCKISCVEGQIEVEIHATATPCPEGVTLRASDTGRFK
jgi:hypothetical protein